MISPGSPGIPAARRRASSPDASRTAGRRADRDLGQSFRTMASALPSGRERRNASGFRSSIRPDDRETDRLELSPEGDGVHARFVSGLAAGTRYGFRADGTYAPERGLWFDPDKLLVDPYAVEIDRPYVFDRKLSARRGEGDDTAPLVPKAVAVALPDPVAAVQPLFQPGGLIYEVPVRAFTMRHPDVPEHQRGTIAALAASGHHRAFPEAQRVGGRTHAGHRMDRRAPSAAARSEQWLGLQPGHRSWRSIRGLRRAAWPN